MKDLYEETKEKLSEKREAYKNLIINNLEIKIYLKSPVAIIGLLHLEGILQYKVLKDVIGEDFFNLDPDKHIFDIPIPIEWKGKTKPFPSCSSAIFPEKAEYITRWRKRWDNQYDEWVKFKEGKMQRIDHKSGFFKAYNMPVVSISTPYLLFYCRGCQGEIERLMEDISFIGKKRSQGFGEIRKIEVDKIKGDWSVWKDKILTRPVPVSETPFHVGNIIQIAYKPPYHWIENLDMCWMPGSKLN